MNDIVPAMVIQEDIAERLADDLAVMLFCFRENRPEAEVGARDLRFRVCHVFRKKWRQCRLATHHAHYSVALAGESFERIDGLLEVVHRHEERLRVVPAEPGAAVAAQ